MSNLPTDPVDKPNIPKVGPSKVLEEGVRSPADRASFQQLKETAPSAGSPTTEALSPMDLASKQAISSTPTYQSLLSQSANARDTLGEIEKNLNTANLKFKKSQEDLLGTKLKNANDHLADAADKLNAKVPPDTKVDSSASPITRFLAMVGDGQNKLIETQAQLQKLSTSGKEIRPGDMLLIQVKLSQAQQEIEYSTTLLAKVVDSLKTILQTQL